ncbi:MAG: ribonuclease Z [Candidatus Thermoplasmatota archaeon]|nr:ribonuclease Z [Candidatus Thermoplasmatota archaeon]
MTQLQLIFLGTGGSWPTVKRNVTSIAVKRGKDILLFDCGEGTQRQFQKSQLSYMQITSIFISHFHGDHFLGIPGLLQTMQLNDRKNPLHIYGPKGMIDLTHQLLSLGYFKPGYPIYAHEVDDNENILFKGFAVDVLKVNHGIPSLGFRLVEEMRPGKFNKPKALALGIPEGPLFSQLQRGKTVTLSNGDIITPDMVLGPTRKGRTIVYSGDTRPVDNMVEFCKDSDVLIHESTFDSSHDDIAYQYGHSTARQAAEIAQKGNVQHLFLVHISPRYLDYRLILDEAKKVFSNSVVPKDFDVFTVPLKK